MKYIVALDQGTTSSRAILFDKEAKIVGVSQKEYTQHFPKPGWVEHDPEEIWASQLEVFESLLKEQKIDPSEIISIGITNQRETTLIWDKNSGKPLHNAIVWQDKRTSAFCDDLKNAGHSRVVQEKTGLVIDSYFSGTKIKWLLDHVDGARAKAANGELLAGTIDSWLIWKMTNGERHVTDQTNASRTLLFNINNFKWDIELLDLLDIPGSILPEVLPSSADFGNFTYKGASLPINGVAGDQQSALFGQACFHPGEAKNTYGTGCFLLMNIGNTPKLSENGLLTTVACSVDGKATYAFEGSVFVAGAVVQWLRDGLKIIENAKETEKIAKEVSEDEVIVVPAFAGLGVPYWDSSSRGAIFGLTRDTNSKHFVKAALQSIAFQTKDIVEAIQEDTKVKMECLNVDGGASMNDFLMQFQSDMLDIPVDRPEIFESTALGAAYLAGLRSGVWTIDDLKKIRKTSKLFEPDLSLEERTTLYNNWKDAVSRTLNWHK